MSAMTLPANLDQLSADELYEQVRQQTEIITRNDRKIRWSKAEHLPVKQGQLFEETLAVDMAAITEELAHFFELKPKRHPLVLLFGKTRMP